MSESLRKAKNFLWPSCPEAVARFSKRLDGTLPWYEYPGLAIRVALCKLTRRHTAQIYFVNEAVRCLDEKMMEGITHPQSFLSQEAKSRLKSKMDI